MVEGHHRVKLLHNLRIVQRHLNGRAAAVHGEGLGAGARVGVALHRRLIIGRIVGVGRELLLGIAGNGRAVAHMVEGNDGIHRLRLLGRVGKDDRFRLHGAVVVHDDLLHVDLQGLIAFGRVDGKFVDGVAAGIAFKRLRLRHGLLRLVHIDGADGALHRLLFLGKGEHGLRRGQRAVGIRGHLHAGLAHERIALRLAQIHLDGHAAALHALGGGGVERLASGLVHVFDGHLHVQVLLHLLLGEQAKAVVPHIAVRSVVVDPIPAIAIVVKALNALGGGHDDILVHALHYLVVFILGGRAGAQVQAALGGDAILVGVLLQHHGLGGRVRVVIQRHVNRRARAVHRKALLSGRGVGIAFNLRLVVRGGIGIRRKLLLRAGQLLIGGGILVMERHHRVDRLRRILRVVQRHLDRRAGPVHVKAHGVRALEGITVDGDGICRRIIRSRREALRRVVSEGRASVAGVPVMERDGRIHRFRRVLRIVQRHLDGRTGPVRREALRIRRRVGIPLHLHLVDRGIGLHARGRFFRGVAGDLLICVLVQMMDRHNRVHRFRRARRIVQRHLDGRTRSIHGKGVGGGIRIGISLHRLLIGGRAVGFGGQLLPGIAGDLLSGHFVEMMERNRGVDHLRLALLHLENHGIGAGGAVGVERHKHLAGADELVARRYQRQVGREAPPLDRDNVLIAVKLLAAFIAVGDIDRAAGGSGRLVGRDGNGGKVERIGDLEHAAAVHLDARGNRAVHRRGVARQQRSSRGAVSNQLRVLGAGDALDAHARLHRLLGHGGPIDHLVSVERGRDRHALYASVRRAPLDGHGGKHADILRQRGQRQNHLRRDEQQAGQKRRGASEGFRNMLCHMRNPPYAG